MRVHASRQNPFVERAASRWQGRRCANVLISASFPSPLPIRSKKRGSYLPPPLKTPVRGGPKIRICDFCEVGWGADDRFFYLRLRDIGEMSGGKVYVITLPAGKSLPALPPSGIKSAEDLKGLNVVSVIDMTGISNFAPGPNPPCYAYARLTVQRIFLESP